MARSDIPARRDHVRQWWLHHAQNPMLLKLLASSWSEPVHIERWMDMQARMACAEEGNLLASDVNWKLVKQQIDYPPLWLVNNWHLKSIKKVSSSFKSRYYTLGQNQNAQLIATQANTIPNSIAANDERLYEWLGVIGGSLTTIPPVVEQE